MSARINEKELSGKRGELFVFTELLKRGLVSYVPLVDEGIDALVRTSDEQLIEIQIKAAGSAGGKFPRWFGMPEFSPKRNFFIVAIEFSEDEPKHAWIFPSSVYDQYAARPPKRSPRDLDLDGGIRKYGMPLKDLLCGFRDRWELIVEFAKYERHMDSPEDLVDLLAHLEASEHPENESIDLSDYERRRSKPV
ncbi:MAG: hypothetical protein BZY88_17135 [SAR202 cluster bacterium Io17-Chloro-G9]|nr:MAG: hypothetical protein BZY88_17135 [SAR202 cluster bacterium Io17-Chloro-G9]